MNEVDKLPVSKQIKNTREKLKTSFNDLKQDLKLPEHDKVLSIVFYKEIPVAERLVCKDIYMVKIQQKNGQVYYIGVNGKKEKILNLQQDGKIMLDEDGQRIFEKLIGEKGKQTDAQKEIYDYDKESYVEHKKKGEIRIS